MDDFESSKLDEFIAGGAKQFCPWCGAPVTVNPIGRKKKFCSDKCRWAFWKFETRHKDLKVEMEEKLNGSRKTKGAAGHQSKTGCIQSAKEAEARR